MMPRSSFFMIVAFGLFVASMVSTVGVLNTLGFLGLFAITVGLLYVIWRALDEMFY